MNEQLSPSCQDGLTLEETVAEKRRIDWEHRKQLKPRIRERETEELLYEITSEYCMVSSNLKKLKKAIEANPESVSEDHKKLWKLQADFMGGYKRTLAERIKDILNHN